MLRSYKGSDEECIKGEKGNQGVQNEKREYKDSRDPLLQRKARNQIILLDSVFLHSALPFPIRNRSGIVAESAGAADQQ
jgi:hypothetical protein